MDGWNMKPHPDNSIHAWEQNLRLLDRQVEALGEQAKFALLAVALMFAIGIGMIGYALHQDLSGGDSVAYAPQYEMNSFRR
jgi:hypothetical protein